MRFTDLLRRSATQIRDLAEAAGVTYLRSEEARREESADEDVYARVYRAERPELFFKSPVHRATEREGFVVR